MSSLSLIDNKLHETLYKLVSVTVFPASDLRMKDSISALLLTSMARREEAPLCYNLVSNLVHRHAFMCPLSRILCPLSRSCLSLEKLNSAVPTCFSLAQRHM